MNRAAVITALLCNLVIHRRGVSVGPERFDPELLASTLTLMELEGFIVTMPDRHREGRTIVRATRLLQRMLAGTTAADVTRLN